MKILAVNPGHNGSAAYLVDGKLEFYIEEERLSRSKYDGNPFRGILLALTTGVDYLVIGGTNKQPSLNWTGEDPFTALVRKYNKNVQVIDLSHQHHLGHAAGAFFNSGFKNAAAIIVDGSGSNQQIQFDEEGNNVNEGFETESIYNCSIGKDEDGNTKSTIEQIWKSYASNQTRNIQLDGLSMDNSITIVKAYEAVSEYLGFGFIEAGKTMGLAPYGKDDENIPDLFFNGRGNKNIFIPNYPAGAFIDEQRISYLQRTSDPKEWHSNSDAVTEQAKNLAWKVQQETQSLVGDLIQKAIDETGHDNIVIAGGYGLNCVANYYYKKRFPNINLFVDPISHDGGTAIGLAKFMHSEITKEIPESLETLYLGPGINGEVNVIGDILLDYGEMDPGLFDVKYNVEVDEVAQLIADKNIVSFFQGKSEAGPRALGNRSILYDPRDPDGKDNVNKVKGREWFRPFAGSMLKEHFEEWFETHGMEESPHMMYAMDFKLEKHGEVPAITHVDGTCRIQTVTEEQNKNYYDLINAFYNITGVPIVFNTSFNLAGEPLVESFGEALDTILGSDIQYLYVPDKKMLVIAEKNYAANQKDDAQMLTDSVEPQEEFFEAGDEE